jgi:hypothetical protein
VLMLGCAVACAVEVRVASAAVDGALELTEENVEFVLDEVSAAVAAAGLPVTPTRRGNSCASCLSRPAAAARVRVCQSVRPFAAAGLAADSAVC